MKPSVVERKCSDCEIKIKELYNGPGGVERTKNMYPGRLKFVEFCFLHDNGEYSSGHRCNKCGCSFKLEN